jgi:hypothetical protein
VIPAATKFIQNSKSFTCLLKEIDEEEEKNLVGSIPGGKVGRPLLDQVIENEEITYVGSEKGGLSKSRNTHSNSAHNLKTVSQNKGGSTVNFGTGASLQKTVSKM